MGSVAYFITIETPTWHHMTILPFNRSPGRTRPGWDLPTDTAFGIGPLDTGHSGISKGYVAMSQCEIWQHVWMIFSNHGYKWYILPFLGIIYHWSHLLGEPETTIDMIHRFADLVEREPTGFFRISFTSLLVFFWKAILSLPEVVTFFAVSSFFFLDAFG